MAFGYQFVTLTEDQKLDRRLALDTAALAAQWSAVIVLVIIQCYFLLTKALQRWTIMDDRDPPSSPHLKYQRKTGRAWIPYVHRSWSKWRWWAGEPAIEGWDLGKKGEWVLASAWAAWLLFLCIVSTGDDYLHLTKRFGIVGASQLPLHYLLALKSPCSPIQLLTHMSHEELNVGHQILGRIITFLFVLHATFYLNFFVVSNLLYKRIGDQDVLTGLTGTILFILVGSTALNFVRRWNYRIFYFIHTLLATALLPLLYLHVHHIRPFIWETAAVYLLHSILRYFSTRTFHGQLSILPNTDLIQIGIPLTTVDSIKSWTAGQHVYLRLPTHPSTPSALLKALKERIHTNPFTVASLPYKDNELVLIARTLSGQTKQLAALARSVSVKFEADDKQRDLLFKLEGPYGASSWLFDLSLYDRVLLVAGGVGATFVLPIWRHILDQQARSSSGRDRAGQVRLVWAVRSMAETKWVFEDRQRVIGKQPLDAVMELFVTGRGAVSTLNTSASSAMESADEGFELSERHQLLERGNDNGDTPQGVVVRTGRPDLRMIVDELFAGNTEKAAVLVCGPGSMVRELRKAVGGWVKSGKDVYWHAETFAL